MTVPRLGLGGGPSGTVSFLRFMLFFSMVFWSTLNWLHTKHFIVYPSTKQCAGERRWLVCTVNQMAHTDDRSDVHWQNNICLM